MHAVDQGKPYLDLESLGRSPCTNLHLYGLKLPHVPSGTTCAIAETLSDEIPART